jgi:pullulanase-type alpha-1,6-glucosidase
MKSNASPIGRIALSGFLGLSLFLFSFWLLTGLNQDTAVAETQPASQNSPQSTNWCVAGDFNGWNNASHPLNDDGLDGDLFAGDGLFARTIDIASAGRTEFKAVECGNWGNAFPQSNNAWVWLDAPGPVVVTFDTNDRSGNAGLPYAPGSNVVNVRGDDGVDQSYTVVGPWQSWTNDDPDTAMTNLGNGHHVLTYTFATAGSYEAKVSATGNWDFQFGGDGRSVDGAIIPFTVANDGDVIAFYLDAINGRLAITPSTTGSGGPWCVAGDFNGWSADSDPLNDDGLSGDLIGGDGLYSLDYTIATPGRYEFKINACDWATSYPNSNAWVITSEPDQVVKFTFDTNDYSGDAGWPFYPTTNIVNAWDDFPSPFVAVGGWQSWNPNNPATTLTDLGYGQHALAYTIATPGTEEVKVTNDEWANQIGADGRGTNADTIPFTTDTADEVLNVYLDGVNGRLAAFVIPAQVEEPEDPFLATPISHTIQDEIFYFVLPDRYYDGDPTNNEGPAPGGTLTETGYLPTDKAFYHGGDIVGLESKLDYIQDMGITAIWLTPVFENRPTQPDGSTSFGIGGAYHGYWIQDFEGIDPHLGTEQEVLDFIAEAQSRGIKIFFDIVANHTADYIIYAEGQYSYRNKTDYPYRDADGNIFDDKDYVNDPNFPEMDPLTSFPYTPVFADPSHATIKNPAWLNDVTLYHNRGDTTFVGESSEYGDFFGLDDLFTEHPTVVAGFIDIFTRTIQVYNIDGFRVDTVKHVNDEFWQELVPVVMDYAAANGKPDFFMFGEVFEGNPAVLSYYTSQVPFPSVLDFGLHGTANSFAAGGLATDNVRNFFAADDYYTNPHSNAYLLANFISNHDIGRIGRTIVNNNGGEPDANWVQRSELGHALIYFARGFPVVYYGDEQGFTGGGGDKDARQDMFPSQVAEYDNFTLIGTTAQYSDDNFDQTHPLYLTLADYAGVLENHLALRRGAQIHRYSQSSAGIYAFSRIERNEQIEYLVVLNNATSSSVATIPTWSPATDFTPIYPTGGGPITSAANGDLNVSLPALSVAIYRAADPLPASSSAPANPTFNTLTPNQEVAGRVEVGVALDAYRFAEVTFAVSIDDGPYELIGTDTNTPFRVFYDVSHLPTNTSLRFKATVNDLLYPNAEYGVSAISVTTTATAEPGEGDYFIFHYFRADGDYGDFDSSDYNDFWGLHLWGHAIDPDELPTWTEPRKFSGFDNYGAFLAVRLIDDSQLVNFIIHRGDEKDGTDADRFFDPSVAKEIWLVGGDPEAYTSPAEALQATFIHYNRDDDDYDDWGLHLWQDGQPPLTDWPDRHMPDSFDDFGAVFSITVSHYPTLTLGAGLNFIVHNGQGTQEPDRTYTPTVNYEVWVRDGRSNVYTQKYAALGEFGTAVIHYHRCFGDYGDYDSSDYNDFWGLHTWGAATDPGWTTPRKADGFTDFGVYFEVPLINSENLNYILHRGDEKDVPDDQTLNLAQKGYEIWIVQNDDGFQHVSPAIAYNVIGQVCGGAGDISRQRAYWLAADSIGWQPQANPADIDQYRLYYDADAGITLGESGLSGGSFITLTVNVDGLDPDIQAKFPHLASLPALEVATANLPMVADILKGQFVIAAYGGDGTLLDATGLQIPGVLDDLYAAAAYDQPLGMVWNGDTPTINLWAPTAQNVTFHLFADSDPLTTSDTYTMTWDADSGIWSITGLPDWNGQYYLFEIDVFAPTTGQIETNIVTDPYSASLAMNSTRSQIFDLNDPDWQPAGWESLVKPPLVGPQDISIYEVHVRDFSAFDESVPAEERGTFRAFTYTDTHGMSHLLSLAEVGLTHLHLLPVFDIATINEDKSTWLEPDYDLLATYPPTSTEQQAAINAIRDQDAFNWGYDPFHYNALEGSYSTNPDGPTRIVEFREMVQMVNENGLRLVVDVVYNHTNAAGQHEKSVLDQVVPGYYHRLNAIGQVETSTCCANTATEHDMMEKLMVDSVVLWATAYRVDAFRFDLMGHHMKRNMLAVRDALDALTLDDHGVDGSAIFVYGEGWNFGEVANNARGENATQFNMAGTGIATFSDRQRDAVRGGGPFDNGEALKTQGFANGLFYDPNDYSQPNALARLLLYSDQIRVGMAGNLAGYQFIDRFGNLVTGADVDYNGSPTGYTEQPFEAITYISKHDNQTLYDINVYGMPMDATMDERIRAQVVGLSTVALGQGVPFFHAGSEMLRSKSLDRDSYNSGDWFNRLDTTYQHNNFGVGLPIAEKNQENWPIMVPYLGNPDLVAGEADITLTTALFEELLAIRHSSPLFRLGTADLVQERVAYHNTGPSQLPGLIVMSLSDLVGDELDPNHELIVVLINANDEAQSFTETALVGLELILHPIQQNSADPLVQTSSFDAATGSFEIPGRTTAVFVLPTPVVIEPPAAGFESNSPVVVGETAVFTNTTSGTAPISYEWHFGDGSPVVTDPNPTHLYAAPGSYTVTLTATNAAGSSVYAAAFVVEQYRFYLPIIAKHGTLSAAAPAAVPAAVGQGDRFTPLLVMNWPVWRPFR